MPQQANAHLLHAGATKVPELLHAPEPLPEKPPAPCGALPDQDVSASALDLSLRSSPKAVSRADIRRALTDMGLSRTATEKAIAAVAQALRVETETPDAEITPEEAERILKQISDITAMIRGFRP